MAHRELEIPLLTERWPSLMRPVVRICRKRNLSDILKDMNSKKVGEGDLHLFGHYASCILIAFPSLEEKFIRAISELGGNVSTTTNSYSAITGCSTNRLLPGSLFSFCQLCFLFFKSTDSLSYVNDMNSTIRELKSIFGFQTFTPTDGIALDFEVAVKISTVLGSINYLRTSLLSSILNAAKPANLFGCCCNYTAKRLAWTDMLELKIINDVLLVNNSPVLGDARVVSEVQNLHETFNVINRSSYPQYFGINASESEASLLDSWRFPLLIKVVQHISNNQSFTDNQIVSTPPVNDEVVLQLVAIHEEFMQLVSQLVAMHKEFMQENKVRSIGRVCN